MDSLLRLGQRLRDKRLKRGESQKVFAARIGISIPTLKKMETGDGSVKIGNWLWVFQILGAADSLDTVLADEDLFQRYPKQSAVRVRAPRKKGL